MKKDRDQEAAGDGLRRHAEEKLDSRSDESAPAGSNDEILRLLHELQVHQIELELQNADLSRSRDELENSLEKYTSLYDFAPVGYFTLERTGSIMEANLTGAGILGGERSRLIGRRFGLFIAAEYRDSFADFLEEVYKSRGKQSCETMLNTVGKAPLFVQLEATVPGPAQECRLAVIDITGRIKLEESLAQSEGIARAQAERLRSVMDAAPAVIWIAHDRECRSITGNRAAQELLRLGPREEQSKTGPDPDKLAHFRLFKDGVELAGNDLPVQRVALSGKPLFDYAYDIIFEDGTIRSLLGNIIPVLDAEGRPDGAVAAMLDITERKQVEDKIQRLASFPLMNPNPILELDVNGRIVFCNPAAKQLLETAEYNGKGNPFLPWDMPMILQDLADKKTDKVRREIEINGGYFEELICITPLFQSVRIYTMDITERKKLGEKIERLNTDLAERALELEGANLDLEAFNYTVAHDLRQPLSVITSYCQVIMELCVDSIDEECRGYLQSCYAGALKMGVLIETLLNFSRVGHVEPSRHKVDLSVCVNEAVSMLKLTGPERQVDFRIADGITADADPDLLRVVLDNLLGNAWKYTSSREVAVIEFGATDVNGKPVYFVRDNGIGFDPADAEMIFTPFKRLPGAGKNSGSGIGLATVERIIRRHGGRIWAEGAPGKGAIFRFTLTADH